MHTHIASHIRTTSRSCWQIAHCTLLRKYPAAEAKCRKAEFANLPPTLTSSASFITPFKPTFNMTTAPTKHLYRSLLREIRLSVSPDSLRR